MATDKLINHSQGESIITNLDAIATNLQNVTAISPAKFGMGYAVCDTAAGTAAKTANIANYVLTEGALVTVKFTNANTASNATLNLNNTGAKPILYKGSALTTDIISAGDICTFIYSTANSGSYNIINVDALSGAGAGTVKSVGAEGGLTTDQTSGAAISTTGSVKLNLKSESQIVDVGNPDTTTTKTYPVALDSNGYPGVAVPWTDTIYSTFTDSADGLVPAADGTGEDGMFLKGDGTWATPTDTNTTYTVETGTANGKIKVTPSDDTAYEVPVYGLNNAAYKDVATSISASGAVDTKVATEKAVADSISGKAIGADSSTTNAIATFAGTDGKTLADSAVTIAKDATGVTDDDTKVPTSKAVKTYVDATATGISRYIGTITATSQLSTTAKKGDFYIVSTAWTGVHAGDEIIAEKDNPAQTIDGTNWTLLHNEADTNTTYTFAEGTTNGKFTVTPSDTGTAQSVTVHGLAASAYRDVDTTPTASSTKLVESGGVASALSGKQDTLTFDGAYSASTNKAATVSTVTNAINALDVSEVTVGATKTINKISQTDGKISVTTTDIQSASTSQKGLVQLNDTLVSTSTTLAATANAVKAVNDKAETNKSNILYAIRNGAKNLYEPNINTEYYNKNGANITQTYSNGAITIKGTTATAAAYLAICEKFTPNYTGEYVFSSASGLIQGKFSMYVATGSSFVGEQVTADNPARTYSLTAGTTYTLGMIVSENYTIDTTIYPMLCEKTVWDNLNHDFQPPSLPNYDLTRLEAEDRASLAEEIDSGAKNKWDFANCGSGNWHATTSKTDTSFTVTSTDTRAYFSMWQSLPAGHYVFSAKISNLSGPDYKGIAIRANSTSGADLGSVITFNANGTISGEFTCTATTTVYFVCYASMDSFTSTTTYTASDIMVCTKAAFGVSSKFVPYRPNYDLVCQSLPYVIRDSIATSTDYTLISTLPIALNRVGVYRISAFQDYSHTNPRGIIISRSNSDYTESMHVLAKSETSSDVASLSTSCLLFHASSVVTNLYFWAKAKTVTTNQMGVIIEYLG